MLTPAAPLPLCWEGHSHHLRLSPPGGGSACSASLRARGTVSQGQLTSQQQLQLVWQSLTKALRLFFQLHLRFLNRKMLKPSTRSGSIAPHAALPSLLSPEVPRSLPSWLPTACQSTRAAPSTHHTSTPLFKKQAHSPSKVQTARGKKPNKPPQSKHLQGAASFLSTYSEVETPQTSLIQ